MGENYANIPIPYEGDQELILDPGTIGTTYPQALEHLQWLFESQPGFGMTRSWAEETERVFRATTILFNANAGTFAECLHTAIVWERG